MRPEFPYGAARLRTLTSRFDQLDALATAVQRFADITLAHAMDRVDAGYDRAEHVPLDEGERLELRIVLAILNDGLTQAVVS